MLYYSSVTGKLLGLLSTTATGNSIKVSPGAVAIDLDKELKLFTQFCSNDATHKPQVTLDINDPY